MIIKQYAIKGIVPIHKGAITVHVILDGQDVTAIKKLTNVRRYQISANTGHAEIQEEVTNVRVKLDGRSITVQKM